MPLKVRTGSCLGFWDGFFFDFFFTIFDTAMRKKEPVLPQPNTAQWGDGQMDILSTPSPKGLLNKNMSFSRCSFKNIF
jgi:hypothetical protein